MRLALLLALLAAASPAAAQGILVAAAHCPGSCHLAGDPPHDRIDIDSVSVGAILERGTATTYVTHEIHNPTAAAVEGAFFFPLPRGATVTRVALSEKGRLEQYNQWSTPAESRRILRQILRERPGSQLRSYSGVEVMHVRIPPIPPGATRRLQIGYSQPLQARGRALVYRYPLGRMAAAPVQRLTLGLTVTTRAGFDELRSPSHPVNVTWGTELGPCPPQSRCGSTSVPSRRVKLVRLQEDTTDAGTRDFVLVYTPSDERSRGANLPWSVTGGRDPSVNR